MFHIFGSTATYVNDISNGVNIPTNRRLPNAILADFAMAQILMQYFIDLRWSVLKNVLTRMLLGLFMLCRQFLEFVHYKRTFFF